MGSILKSKIKKKQLNRSNFKRNTKISLFSKHERFNTWIKRDRKKKQNKQDISEKNSLHAFFKLKIKIFHIYMQWIMICNAYKLKYKALICT